MARPLQIHHEVGLSSFLTQLATFRRTLAGLDEADFWSASRCRGWCVADVVTHVHLGLQEMLLGVLSPTAVEADTDAANYWAGSPADDTDPADQLHQLHFVRLLTAAHRRPGNLLHQLEMTATALVAGGTAMPAGQVSFQGRVLSTGDFLATWAVELAIHQLDLGPEVEVDPPERTALGLARQTVENLAEQPFPVGWSDERVVLLGTGRVAPSQADRADLGALADRLPVLG